VLLILALACFLVAAFVLPTTSGRPVLTWMSVGLVFVTLSLLLREVHLRR